VARFVCLHAFVLYLSVEYNCVLLPTGPQISLCYSDALVLLKVLQQILNELDMENCPESGTQGGGADISDGD